MLVLLRSPEFNLMAYARAAYVKAKYPCIPFPGLLVSVWKVSSRMFSFNRISVCFDRPESKQERNTN